MIHQLISVSTAGLLVFVAAVAVTDLRSQRIPNLLTVPAAAIGLAVNLSSTGPIGALESGAGLLAGLALFLPFYLAGQFGGGDVKAMGAIGAFVGPKAALFAAMWILVAGGIGAVIVLITSGGYPAVLALARRWMFRAWVICATGRPSPVEVQASDPASHRFPYGLAIACGTVASLAWS